MSIIRFLTKRIIQRKIIKLEIKAAKYSAIAEAEQNKASSYLHYINHLIKMDALGDDCSSIQLHGYFDNYISAYRNSLANSVENKNLAEIANIQIADLMKKIESL